MKAQQSSSNANNAGTFQKYYKLLTLQSQTQHPKLNDTQEIFHSTQ